MTVIKPVSVADIAIVGLGDVGARFLDEMLRLADRGIRIVAVAETEDTPGRRRALGAGIDVLTLEEIVGRGHAVDVIFDLTGSLTLRRLLREQMIATNNRHTIIAPETMARLLWAVVTDEILTGGEHANSGY